MTFSVMITTRNRAAELRRTCRVLRGLNPAPLEMPTTAWMSTPRRSVGS
jgi:hypothetical protein